MRRHYFEEGRVKSKSSSVCRLTNTYTINTERGNLVLKKDHNTGLLKLNKWPKGTRAKQAKKLLCEIWKIPTCVIDEKTKVVIPTKRIF